MGDTIYKEDIESTTTSTKKSQIVIYNDDINTFEHVICTLMEICEHDYIQAANCTNIIHWKGKCGVKTGDYEKLKPIHLKLVSRKLKARIE